jgi:hypothetical protein
MQYLASSLQAFKECPIFLQVAVVDTIVAKVQGVPEDDRCVLLLGKFPPFH